MCQYRHAVGGSRLGSRELCAGSGERVEQSELTCQHVDPERPLAHDAHAVFEVKILIFKGFLEDALRKVLAQRQVLK